MRAGQLGAELASLGSVLGPSYVEAVQETDEIDAVAESANVPSSALGEHPEVQDLQPGRTATSARRSLEFHGFPDLTMAAAGPIVPRREHDPSAPSLEPNPEPPPATRVLFAPHQAT